VETELAGRESEPWEIIYFKLYKSQIPIVEQAIETAALMLGTDKARGYCLQMICAYFLAGANLDNGTQRRTCSPGHGSSNSFPAKRGRLFCTRRPREPDTQAAQTATGTAGECIA